MTPRRNFLSAALAAVAAMWLPAAAAAPQRVHIYKLNDFEWWAGPNLAACIADWKEQTSQDDEQLDDPRQLTEEELDRLMFSHTDEDETPYRKQSFRAELAEQIAAGVSFPSFFATTEY